MNKFGEINGDDIDSQEEFNRRASVASFLGTLQAGFSDFHYLRDIWKTTTEKDALIGVGITGIGSGKILKYNLKEASNIVKQTNIEISKLIGINSAARTTTIKPSGTTSCVLGTSSGIHAWHNDYYIRRLRINNNESICKYLKDTNPELVEDAILEYNTSIVSIPQSAPEGSILRNESAIELLERVKKFNLEWVREGHNRGDNTNNVSATISIDKNRRYSHDQWDEWQAVARWMWANKDTFNGLSVLPYNNGIYKQAPFEDITKERYEELVSKINDIDLTKVIEKTDETLFIQEPACSGGSCEIKY